MKVAAVIAAGGTGTRLGDPVPKQLLEIGGKPVLLHTLETILSIPEIVQIVIALPRPYVEPVRKMLGRRRSKAVLQCVPGGANRQESVLLGVQAVRKEAGLILVHDAVRPLCDPDTMMRVVDAARRSGGAVAGLPATETIQRVSRRGRILSTPPRSELYSIQTPQAFHSDILRKSLDLAHRKGYLATDESSVVRWAGHMVTVVPGSPDNIKITRRLDLRLAEMLLSGRATTEQTNASRSRGRRMDRIGQGIDYHRLRRGRPLVLGGVTIPHERGLDGHSDADVLLHSICDALLGAAAMGDIGRHFPDNDPSHRARPSIEFLREIRRKLKRAGWSIKNIDATVLAERPRLAPFVPEMRANIAKALGITESQVSVKATSTEGMNAEGRQEGISSQAVALLERS